MLSLARHHSHPGRVGRIFSLKRTRAAQRRPRPQRWGGRRSPPPAGQTDAVAAATAAVTAFARLSLPEQQWWTELLPLLSQKGAVAYEGTLPSNIPVTTVTGAAVVLDASTDVATLVEVPTDAGAYIVTLVRGSTDEPWLAERIRPAGQ